MPAALLAREIMPDEAANARPAGVAVKLPAEAPALKLGVIMPAPPAHCGPVVP